MATSSFIEKLLMRLKSGDARSIHLNALPGNFARLDVYDLINIEQSLHLRFLENLLTKKEFKFSITIEPSLLSTKSSEEKKIIQRIIKRLNHLDYQNKEEFAEHGYHSFGFGFPLLIKKDINNSDKILKAPLLIWYLDIEKDTRKNNTWIISKNENHSLIFNEQLQSYFESTERIKTEDLETYLEDDFINETQLNNFCKKLLDKLNIPFDADGNIITLLPSTNAETLDNLTKESAWIRWSGVFGLYKMQKQSIIKDLELLMKSESESESENILYFEGENLSPIVLDPSQENVLFQVSSSNKIIIQGPPGTGKSQSLTAIITQALLNKKKVLVVCEKRTAMEVLYNNLKKENLHHLCVLMEDVYRDRRKIVDTVRDIIEQQEQTPERFRNNEFELLRTKFLSLQEEINFRINFSNTAIFGDDNWTELLSKSRALNQNDIILEKANTINKLIRNSDYAFTYEEFLLLSEKINIAYQLFSTVKKEAFIFDKLDTDFLLKAAAAERFTNEIQQISDEGNRLQNDILSNLKEYKNNYDQQKGFTAFIVSVLALFSNKYQSIKKKKAATHTALTHFISILQQYKFDSFNLSENDIDEKISLATSKLEQINQNIQQYTKQLFNFYTYFQSKKFLLAQDGKTQAIIGALQKIGDENWDDIFTTYYLNQTILKTALENNIKDDAQKQLEELYQTDILLKQKLSEKINTQWKIIVQNMMEHKDLSEIKYLYNQRKNKQFTSKNSLRKIIHQDIDLFTTLFPVIMVNPSVCTSILPLQENLFDFIILDEASQLRLEETYSSLLRGKIKIISGDKHQMPPSNFFGNDVIFWNEKEDENSVEGFLAESKSLLEYAEDGNYKSTYLDYHYRSLHPDLIQFSNYAFYQSRLIPLPEKQAYKAIHYYNVDGIYESGINEKEAEAIVEFIFKIEANEDHYPSIGVATFNIFQRNLIMDKLYETAYSDRDKNDKLQALLQAGLFVKNLENIQGDERDIMILSTTFGKDKEGKFRQAFGPLTQEKGYQLLNVIITRAKHSMYVFSSIPESVFLQFEEELLQKGNTGKSIFYAYLAYTKACMENNISLHDFIKTTLQKNVHQFLKIQQQEPHAILKQQVYDALKPLLGNSIKQNYLLGGFKLDMVVFRNELPILYLDFEHTENYHPEVAYRIKLHRQKITAAYGIIAYHIWSYNWWKDAEQEIKKIETIIKSFSNGTMQSISSSS